MKRIELYARILEISVYLIAGFLFGFEIGIRWNDKAFTKTEIKNDTTNQIQTDSVVTHAISLPDSTLRAKSDSLRQYIEAATKRHSSTGHSVGGN